ncbi:sigma factor-like helix-turn-helix DNA-binding protein [Salisaeta longa]|uniref:sigma factor-like helix-turn-helix DNA-binding protein n=1 Tax=Salisaeta longa TaxID=503170 RepID=UPI0003B6B8B5
MREVTLQKQVKKEIDHRLSTLQDREAEVMRLYYGLGYKRRRSIREIGRRLEIASQRVRQIKKQAMHKLRRSAT